MRVLYLQHNNKIYNNWCCVNKRNLNYINNQNIIIWWQRGYPFVLYVYAWMRRTLNWMYTRICIATSGDCIFSTQGTTEMNSTLA